MDVTVGTERALFRLARGTCYYPDCLVPILRDLDGHPVVNVEIAHLRGEKIGSARYDAAMTDAERASFANLLLMCTAHHKLIDRIAPDEHPPELLTAWKERAEARGGIEALHDIDALLSTSGLDQLIERVAAKLGPTRDITVEVGAAVLYDGVQAFGGPMASVRELLRVNDAWRTPERVVVTTIRNVGFSDVVIESVSLSYTCRLTDKPDDDEAVVAFLGANHYPSLNPDLPKRLLAGESMRWLTNIKVIAWTERQASNAIFTSLYAVVALGSGEHVESGRSPWGDIPFHDT